MKLRGAISGFGEVAAKAHLPGWRTRDRIDVQVVHEPVAARRHEAINLIRGVRVYDDLELMLAGESPDFVDVASPPSSHATSAKLALAAGAHVLVEKPLCLTLDQFDELASLAAKNDRVLMCVHNWKYAPPYATARSVIESGRLGRVRNLNLERLRIEPAGAGRAGGAWRTDVASGGGILIDHGWHVFYLMRWLLGGESPIEVVAHLEYAANGVDEVAGLQVTFANGASARANLSWRSAARTTSAVVEGEHGTLEIEGDRVILTARSGSREDLSVADMPDDSYHAAWFAGVAQEFELAIEQGRRAPVVQANLAEARAAMVLTEASRESARAGGTLVRLPL